MDWTDSWWLVWLLVLFLPVELWAAADGKPGGTFSEWVWRTFGVRRAVPLARVRRATLVAFLAALSAHLVFGTTVAPVAILAVPLAGIIVYATVSERG